MSEVYIVVHESKVDYEQILQLKAFEHMEDAFEYCDKLSNETLQEWMEAYGEENVYGDDIDYKNIIDNSAMYNKYTHGLSIYLYGNSEQYSDDIYVNIQTIN